MSDLQSPEPGNPSDIPKSELQHLEEMLGSTSRIDSPFRKSRVRFQLVRELRGSLEPALTRPVTLAIDRQGHILVLDRPVPDTYRLVRFEADGGCEDVVAEFARGSADTELLEPYGLAIDAGQHLYLCDSQAGAIKKFSPDGRWLETFRSAGSSGSLFNNPRDADVDQHGNIFVADTDNNRVVKLSGNGELVWEIDQFTNHIEGQELDELYDPHSVCITSGELLYVADTNENRVLAFDGNCRLELVVGNMDVFEFPLEVRISKDGQSIYVSDRQNTRVQRFDRMGTQTGSLTITEQLKDESGVTVGGDIDIDADGHVVMITPLRESVVVVGFVE